MTGSPGLIPIQTSAPGTPGTLPVQTSAPGVAGVIPAQSAAPGVPGEWPIQTSAGAGTPGTSPTEGGGAPPPAQTDFYVALGGSDFNLGTLASPWLTSAKVAASTFNPGDTIHFNGGNTFLPFAIPSSGSAGNLITFTSYGTGQANFAIPASTDGITSSDKEYFTLDNLKVTGSGGTSGFGIQLQSNLVLCHNITVTGCTVTGMAGTGIDIYGGTNAGGGLVNPSIVNCTSNGNTIGLVNFSQGISIRGGFGNQDTGNNYTVTNINIQNCIANNNTGVNGFASGWNGSGYFVQRVSGGYVQGCKADTNGALSNNGTSGPSGFLFGAVTGLTVQNNYCSNQKTGGADGVAFDFDGGCDNSIMQFNLSYRSASYGFMYYIYDSGPFTSNHDCVFRYNISIDDLAGGFRAVSGGTKGLSGQLYCNSFHTIQSGSPMTLRKLGGAMTLVIANNNLTSAKAGTTDMVVTQIGNPSGCSLNGNNYYTPNTIRFDWNGVTYASRALWRLASGQETIGGLDTSRQAAPIYMGVLPYLTGQNLYGLEPWRPDVLSPVVATGQGVDLTAVFGINPGSADIFGNTPSLTSIGHAALSSALKTVVIAASGNFTVPADFVSLYCVDTVAAGGGSNGGSTGAGGGAFARITSMATALVPNVTSIQCVIGAAGNQANGGDTCWNASSLANAVSIGSGDACAAEGGKTNVAGVGGIAGLAVNSVGTLKNNGGAGGNIGAGSNGGGGGAGGPFGAGAVGGLGAAAAGRGSGGGGGANGGGAGNITATTTGGSGGLGPFNNSGATGTTTNGNIGTNGNGGGGAGNSGGDGGRGGTGSDWIDTATATNYGSGGGSGGGIGAPGTQNGVGGAFGGGSGGRRNCLGGAGGIRFVYKIT